MQLVAIKPGACLPAFLCLSLTHYLAIPLTLPLFHTLPLPFSSLSAAIQQFGVEVAQPHSSPDCLSAPFATSPSFPHCLPACLPQRFVAHKFHALHLRVSGTEQHATYGGSSWARTDKTFLYALCARGVVYERERVIERGAGGQTLSVCVCAQHCLASD